MAICMPYQPAQRSGEAGACNPLDVVHDSWRMCADTSEEVPGSEEAEGGAYGNLGANGSARYRWRSVPR